MAASKSFLELIPELRNDVYELLFEDYVIDCEDPRYETPGILLACKQTFAEAHGAYYRRSTFRSAGSAAAEKSLSVLNPIYLPLVENVHIDMVTRVKELYGKGQSSFVQNNGEHLFDTAYLAQCAVIWLRRGLEEQKCAGINPDAIKASIKIGDGEVLFTATPFQTFRDRFMESPFRATGDMNNPDAQIAIQNQVRYFEFDHVNPRKCWHRLWNPIPGSTRRYECGCPRKEVEK